MSQLRAWEVLDSMSGSITNEQEQGEVREVRRKFVIGPCEGFNDAVAKIENYAPSYVNSDGAGIYWVRRRLDVTAVGNKLFECTANYQTLIPKVSQGDEGPPQDFVPGSIGWDTTGHTEHITQAISQQAYGDTSVDMQGAINVSGDSVNGLDVVRPCMRYTETWILPRSYIDCDYLAELVRLTGTVNCDAFRCFEANEVLFLGARGNWQGDLPYVTVTFDFEARPNETIDFSPNPPGVAVDKKGWDYLWVRYGTDVSSDTLVQKPIAVYRAEVYKCESWGGLGIAAAVAPGNAAQLPLPPQAPEAPLQLADIGWWDPNVFSE